MPVNNEKEIVKNLTPIRMVTIKNNNNKCWRGCRKIGTLVYYLVGIYNDAAIIRNSIVAPENFENRVIIWNSSSNYGYT